VFAITLNGLFWNAFANAFTPEPTLYETEPEAIEAAQEDARLDAGSPWAVVRVKPE
jgi:hypothetical protein